MNVENKKQIATLLLAFGLGLVAVFLTGQHISDTVTQETKKLSDDYSKKTGMLVGEIEALKKDLNNTKKQQALLAKQAMAPRPSADGTDKPSVQMDAFSLRTPPGKRAMTILIDSLSAVGGLINPGDYVDIVGEINVPKEKTGTNVVTTVLFQNVQVLAVGTNYKPVGAAPQYAAQQKARNLNLTLALTPEEVGLMTFAKAHAKLSLSLRSPAEEKKPMTIEVASWDTLSDFVYKAQGTKIMVPGNKSKEAGLMESDSDDEVKPFIQIFKSGVESNL